MHVFKALIKQLFSADWRDTSITYLTSLERCRDVNCHVGHKGERENRQEGKRKTTKTQSVMVKFPLSSSYELQLSDVLHEAISHNYSHYKRIYQLNI